MPTAKYLALWLMMVWKLRLLADFALLVQTTYVAEKMKQTITPIKYMQQTALSVGVATAYRRGTSVVKTYMGSARKMSAPITCEKMFTTKLAPSSKCY